MRFSFQHIALLSFSIAALGATGCAYPFSVDVESSVKLPLGSAVNCAEANAGELTGTIPADGEPDANGNLTRYEHVFYAGNKCTLKATWQGPLVDMKKIRVDADAQMRELGLEPDEVDVYIRRIEPTVTAVGFDGAHLASGVTYRAHVGVPNASRIIVLEAPEGTDLAHPEVTVSERQKRFLRTANKAWREREPMPGEGGVEIEIDLDEAGFDPGALPEAIQVDLLIHLYGDAAARMTVKDEDVDALLAGE